MSTPELSTEQSNFLDLYALEVKSVRYHANVISSPRTLAEALITREPRAYVLLVRKGDDSDDAVELAVDDVIENWLDMTEGLREGVHVQWNSTGIKNVTLTPVKKS